MTASPGYNGALVVDRWFVEAGSIAGDEDRTESIAGAAALDWRPMSSFGLTPYVEVPAHGAVYLGVPADKDPVEATSAVRVRSRDGVERELAPAAYAMAVRADGRMALAVPDQTSPGSRQLTTLVVRSVESDVAEQWSTIPDQYLPVAWAGDRLIVLRAQGDSGPSDLLVFDGPGKARVLASPGGYLGVAPDGSRVVVQGTDADQPVLVDVATGKATGRLVSEEPLGLLSGVWSAKGYVAAAFAPKGPALLVAVPSGADLVVKEIRVVDPKAVPSLTEPFLSEGVFGGLGLNGPVPRPDGSVPKRPYVLVECPMASSTCTTTEIATAHGVSVVRTAG